MKRAIELLAPGGDLDSIKAAIAAGADAIYCGLSTFNARNRAKNISFDDLAVIINLAHKKNCQVFLTLNIIIVENEFPALIKLLNKVSTTKIDAVIVQDLGLLYILERYFKELNVHGSTQLTTHNEGQIKFLSQLNVERVNLCRELNLNEIAHLTSVAHQHDMLTEVFVHGSYCISFSGLCYMSSVFAGKSGNRGRCIQPCRDKCKTTHEGNNYPLNLKDNSAFFQLEELYNARVDSLKVEGRIKTFDYVYTVVNAWKKKIIGFINNDELIGDDSVFYKVFNRDFSNGFLQGNITKDLFIDNPRDNSIRQFANVTDSTMDKELLAKKREYYQEKDKLSEIARNAILPLVVERIALQIDVSGKAGELLQLKVSAPGNSFQLNSQSILLDVNTSGRKGTSNLDCNSFEERFKSLNNYEYNLESVSITHLQDGLFIPFKELTVLKKQIVFQLNGSKEIFEPVTLPSFTKQVKVSRPTLSVLISSVDDKHLSENRSTKVFFQLPSSFKDGCSGFVDLFEDRSNLIPWFPALLIGPDYETAVKLLHLLKPKQIVTNNSGIAYEAYKMGIPWIAGPQLNISNSFSLLCLQEKLNCTGAFISNELSQKQIKRITCPDDFELFFSIYHPISLMQSRQCLHHQIIGCDKEKVDQWCLDNCNKSSTFVNDNNVQIFVEKAKGHYHSVYNSHNYLNTDIVTDIPGIFDSFFIDLCEAKSETTVTAGKMQLIHLFEKLLAEEDGAQEALHKTIQCTTQTQYRKGI